MTALYLIRLIEEFCKENNLDISKTYEKLAEIYQDNYGTNIEYERRKYIEEHGYIGTPEYLEKRNIVYRYVELLNKNRHQLKN